MGFTFVHASDLHLDCPLVGHSQSPLATKLRQATFQALERIVDLCLDQRVDFLVLAGDLFDAKDRSVRARLFLNHQLRRLHAAAIPTFIVHGNHDPLSGDRGVLGLPSSVKVFGPQWEEVEVRRDGQLICRVQGISYGHEAVVENLALRFHRVGLEFTVGLLHANVGGCEPHHNYAPCSLGDLSESGLDYWALGHVHTRAEHVLPSGGLAVYPGNPQGRHPYETGERGCLLVTVERGNCQTAFFSTDSVRFHRREVDIGSAQTLAGLLEHAQREALSCGSDTALAHAVQLSLVGRGSLHREICDPDGIEQLGDHLRQQIAHRSERIFVHSVLDRTAPALELEQLRLQEGLTRAIIEAAEGAQSESGSPDVWDDEGLQRLSAALRRMDLDPSHPQRALLDRAATRVLDLILETAA